MIMKTIIKRMEKPTPVFFKKVRNTGIILAATGASFVAAPVLLPAIIIKIAGYIALAGGVMGTVSQAAVKMEKK
jgi:hypothetical protein